MIEAPDDLPLLIEFVIGTHVHREPEFTSKLPIVQNGPPGTFVLFKGGARVPLPTDQIVFMDEQNRMARIGFGGMRFEGAENGQLVFLRVRDLEDASKLSPERGLRMMLEPWMVNSIFVDGKRAWYQGLGAN